MIGKFAVIGLGQFGLAVAKKLALRGAEVLAIDRDMERVDIVKDDVAYAVALDSTDLRALSSQNLSEMDAVLVAIGENIEGLLLTTVLLLEMNISRIIARAMSPQQRMILEKIGVKEILSPEDEVASLVTEMLIHPNMAAFLPLPDQNEIAEVKAPRKIIKRSLQEIDLEETYELQLITIKRSYEEYINGLKSYSQHLIRKPSSDIIIEASDRLIVLGKSADIARFLELNE